MSRLSHVKGFAFCLLLAVIVLAAVPAYASAAIYFGNSVGISVSAQVSPYSTTVTAPSGSVGDLLLLQFAYNGGSLSTISVSTGWTLLNQTNQGQNCGEAIYYRPADGTSADNVTLTVSRNLQSGQYIRISGGILRYGGVDPTVAPLVAVASATNTPINSPSVTTTAANSQVISFYVDDHYGVLAYPSGTTGRYSVPGASDTGVGGPGAMAADETQAAIGASTSRSTAGTSGYGWVSHTVVLTPGIAGGSGTTGNSTSTSLTLSAPSGTIAGDFLLAQFAYSGTNVAPATPSGWTQVDVTNRSTSFGQAVYYKVAAGGDSAAFTCTGATRITGGILRYTGVDTSVAPIVAARSGTGTTETANAVTTTAANSRVVSLFGTAAARTLAYPTGLSGRYQNASNPGIMAADETKATAGTTAAHTTTGTNVAWVTQTVAFRPDATPPATASVTTPSGGNVFRAATVPASFSGTVADNTGGSGLPANDTTFTLKRSTDNQYWNGSAWQVEVAPLAATNAATTVGNSTTWTSSATLPTWSSQADGTYTVQASTVDRAGNPFTGTAVSFTLDNTAPVITASNITTLATGLTTPVTFSAAAADANPTSPTVTYWTGSPLTQISNPYSFAPGTVTTITAQATDTAGNTGSQTFTVTVNKRSIVVTAVAASKTYDGTRSSTVAPTVSGDGAAPSDTITYGQVYDTKDVGTGKTLTPTVSIVSGGTTYTGPWPSYYAVTLNTVATGTISARAITVTAAANTKTYDGGTTAAAIPTITSGSLASGDTATWSETYDTKNVGATHVLTPAGSVSDGNGGNDYTVSFQTISTGVITARAITVTAATNTKGYDGTTSAAAAPTITSGALQGSDTAAWSETYNNKNVGTGKTLTPAGSVSDGNSGNNYSITFATNTTGVINARAITVTAATNTKTYDGTTSAAATPTITSGSLASGDTATWTETYADKNAGSSKTLVPAGTITDGNSGNNYNVTWANNTTGVITARAITVTAATNTKTYDGASSAAAMPTITSGALQGSDTATWSETYNNKNVGTGKTLTPAGSVTDGNSGNNYSVSFVANTTGVITARAITVTATANAKVYDATTSAAATPTITSGTLQGSDMASWTESYDSKNVGTTHVLTPAGTVTDGNGGANYTVTFVTISTGVISKAPLDISAATDSKGYDATTSSSGVPTVSGLQGSDSVTGKVQAFDTKNVGTSKTLSVSAYTVNDGNSGGNYTVATHSVSTGVISARAITVTAATNTKGYDGTTSAAAVPTITSGTLVGTDSATFTETYDTKNVGSSKTLVPAGSVSDGNGGANYSVTFANNTTGVITVRAITVTAATNSKGYDGTTTAAANPTITVGSLASGDMASWSEAYASGNVGTGKTLTPSGSVSDGNSGNNYTVTFANNTTGVITARAITVTAAANTKTYDGATTATAIPTITTGSLASGDTATWSEGYADKNVGGSKTLTPFGTVNDGNSGNNYTVTFTPIATGIITARPITVTAATNTKTYDGTTTAAALPSITSGALQGSDSASWSETYADKNVGSAKTLIPAGAVSDGNGGANYAVSFHNDTTGVISAADLTVTAGDQNKTYGQALDLGTTAFTTSGLQSGDSVTSVVLSSAGAAGTADHGTYDITPSDAGGSGVGNYSIAYRTGTLTVAKAGLTVDGVTVEPKTYDGTTNATLDFGGASLMGVVNSDPITLDTDAASGAFADPNAGDGNSVAVAGLSIDGTGAGNYALAQPSVAAAISPKALTITADDLYKSWGESLDLATCGTYFEASGLVGSESIASVTMTCPEAADTQAAVGTYPLAPSDAVPDTGTRLGNYDVTYVDGTLLVQASLSVVGPTTGDTVVRGVPTQVTWSITPAVDTGVFEVWAVGDSGSGDWYDLGTVDAHGSSADYSLDWTPNVPTGSYQICIAYGPDADNWTAVAWPDETFTVSGGITMTTPTPGQATSWLAGSTQTVSWTTDWAPSQGEFCVWLIDGNGGWWIEKHVPVSSVPGTTSYSTNLTVSVPASSGYKVAIYYRPNTAVWSWPVTYKSSADIIVSGCGPITLNAPDTSQAVSWTAGANQTVTWTVASPIPNQGEFCVWLIDSSGGWWVEKHVPLSAGVNGTYTTTLPVSAPVGSGYKLAIYYRPDTSVWSWSTRFQSAANIAVNGCGAITPTTPDLSGPVTWTGGGNQTVTWTVASPIPTQGEFCLWLIDSSGGWWLEKHVPLSSGSNGTYTTSLPITVPAGSGYKLAIYYRPDTSVWTWTTRYQSPANITVAGCGAITPTVPDLSGPVSWTVGSSPTVTWTVASPIPTQGEFCVWLIDSSGGWWIEDHVPLSVGVNGTYSISLPVNVPTGTSYKLAIYYRPDTSVWAWTTSFKSAANITVSSP
jgi:trimeric autotransporter adhesin